MLPNQCNTSIRAVKYFTFDPKQIKNNNYNTTSSLPGKVSLSLISLSSSLPTVTAPPTNNPSSVSRNTCNSSISLTDINILGLILSLQPNNDNNNYYYII